MKNQAVHNNTLSMSPSPLPPLQPRRSLEEVRRARRALLDLYSEEVQDRRQGFGVVDDWTADNTARSQEQIRRLRIIACLDEVLRISAYFTDDRRAP